MKWASMKGHEKYRRTVIQDKRHNPCYRSHGSGKTTTLYAALNRIHTEEKNIITVEDPVEYQLKGLGRSM